MKTVIGIFFVIGLLLMVLARGAEKRETNPDDYASAFVYLAGLGSMAIATVMTAIFALYKLFSN